ncbi:MAG: hypothetical protein KGH72_03825 [Candidatus Micrarchaeota archaeon]|nr:hypothetical protein [Candidatus Micrarchaeota archaeon]
MIKSTSYLVSMMQRTRETYRVSTRIIGSVAGGAVYAGLSEGANLVLNHPYSSTHIVSGSLGSAVGIGLATSLPSLRRGAVHLGSALREAGSTFKTALKEARRQDQ